MKAAIALLETGFVPDVLTRAGALEAVVAEVGDTPCLERRPWLCAAFGAAASPLSFSAGARLGAAELTLPGPAGIGVVSALWFGALPLSFAVAKSAEGRKP